ncbi:MAG: cytochrome c3 family protein [Trichlorobacter sp.]|nr:cytochrome c3 family protein [Trichlorobacter sp.]
MKKTALTLIALIAFAGSAFAAAQDTYEYKGGSFGKVTFSHKTHAKLGCKKCHEGAPAKIEMNKAVAHDKLCIVCHKAEKKGPVGCKDCHKK